MWTDRVQLTGEVEAGAWIAERLTGWDRATGVIPAGFAAYARILHPIEVGVETAPGQYEVRRVAWRDVAARTGRVIHPGVQWESLVRPAPGSAAADPDLPRAWDDGEPEQGNLPLATLGTIRDIVARHTATPQDAWFAVWEGWGSINGGYAMLVSTEEFARTPAPVHQPHRLSDEELTLPRLELPARTYHLFRGPLDAIEELALLEPAPFPWTVSPALWWPEDRAWCVASEIDFDSTLVGGSPALIEEILASPDLEALPLDPTIDLTWHGDHING